MRLNESFVGVWQETCAADGTGMENVTDYVRVLMLKELREQLSAGLENMELIKMSEAESTTRHLKSLLRVLPDAKFLSLQEMSQIRYTDQGEVAAESPFTIRPPSPVKPTKREIMESHTKFGQEFEMLDCDQVIVFDDGQIQPQQSELLDVSACGEDIEEHEEAESQPLDIEALKSRLSPQFSVRRNPSTEFEPVTS